MIESLLILLVPIIGALFYGFERIVKARMQNRMGPPLLQPFYDMFKLMQKRLYLIHAQHALFALLHFIVLWMVVSFIILGGNLLYIIFLHLLSTMFLIMAGFSVRSVYSHMGANRELLAVLAYEPILILMAIGFYLSTGSFNISVIRTFSSSLPELLLLLLALVLIIPIKLKKSPFDATSAHQEIVGGVEIEYSSWMFEFLYMAKCLEYVFVYLLVALFAGNSFSLALFLVVTVFLVVNLVDNSTARVNIQDLMKMVLGFGLILSIMNIIGLMFV